MRENTKSFFKNSLLALLGYAASVIVMAIVPPVLAHDLPTLQFTVGTLLLLCGAGLFFVGYTFILPLKRNWQTVLSVTAAPILILLAAIVLPSVLFQSQYLLLPITIPGNLIFALIPEETGAWQNDFLPPVCLCITPLVLFLCTAVGAVVRERQEKSARQSAERKATKYEENPSNR